jgi:pilus assembly protein CpaF
VVAVTTLEQITAGVRHRVRAGLAVGGPLRDEDLVPLVGAAAAEQGRVLGAHDLLAVAAAVRDDIWGLGPLQRLVEQPGVTDVLVNGPDDVWLDCGEGLRPVPGGLGSEADVRALAVRLAAGAGRRLDEASPWADARLPSGIRFHAVIPPVSPVGTVISLRLLRLEPFGLHELVDSGSLPPAWAGVLEAVVTRRAAFLVSGGTGAGKTTLLATLLSHVPPQERLVLVEDVGELHPRHPHVIRLEARHANVEGRGAVGLEQLVRQALRMRPDRLVVGECRGAEVRELLAALNTGHAGGCGTVHANATADVPARLEALGALAGLSASAVSAQAVAALDAVIHVERVGHRRRVVEIGVVGRGRRGGLDLMPALTADAHDVAHPGVAGPGWPLLGRRLGLDDRPWPDPGPSRRSFLPGAPLEPRP